MRLCRKARLNPRTITRLNDNSDTKEEALTRSRSMSPCTALKSGLRWNAAGQISGGQPRNILVMTKAHLVPRDGTPARPPTCACAIGALMYDQRCNIDTAHALINKAGLDPDTIMTSTMRPTTSSRPRPSSRSTSSMLRSEIYESSSVASPSSSGTISGFWTAPRNVR